MNLNSGGGIIAAVVNPTAEGRLEYFDRAYLLWDGNGVITYFQSEPPPLEQMAHHEILLRENRVVLPGLIDLHTHLPQYEFAGIGTDELLPWLERYTYPQEARFCDDKLAEKASAAFFQSCLKNGTTTVVAYLAPFLPAAHTAFAAAEKANLRAYLGLTLMDRNVPATLVTSVAQAERNLVELLQHYHGKGKLQLVVTPRFAMSCSPDLLSLCGEFSRAHNLFLQTHISENPTEIAETLRLFPNCKSYAAVYDSHGCLHERTLLGHGIHLSEEEIALIRERAAVIVHCPLSNTFLGSGIMPYQRYRAQGLRLGLGSDVAAGYALSMLFEARQMVEVSKLLSRFSGKDERANMEQAIFQATLGNARALERPDLGSFALGKRADLIVIDDSLCDPLLGMARNAYHTLPERLSRIFYRGHPDMVREALVDGKVVFAAGS